MNAAGLEHQDDRRAQVKGHDLVAALQRDRRIVGASGGSEARSVASVFTLAELDRGRAGGRLAVEPADGVPVLQMDRTGVSAIGSVRRAEDAAAMMVGRIRDESRRLRIGVGDADAGPIVDELIATLRNLRPGDDIVRYVVGPTVAAHAGMGTFGIVYHPLDTADV